VDVSLASGRCFSLWMLNVCVCAIPAYVALLAGHIFHNDKFTQYCVKGEWVGKTAGGTFR
jgi:hypothetical protein